MNELRYIVIVHSGDIMFPCGIVCNMDSKHRRKLIDYIQCVTGLSFTGLIDADLDSPSSRIIYADDNKAYLTIHITHHL